MKTDIQYIHSLFNTSIENVRHKILFNVRAGLKFC